MAVYEGRWDCQYCGTTGILGRHKQCINCSRPRPEGVKFYLPEDAPEVTNSQQLAEAEVGADWACEHCSASNRANTNFCTQCGAPKGSSPLQTVKEYGLNEIPRTGKKAVPPPSPTPPKQKSGGLKRKLAASALVLSLGTGSFWFFIPREIPVIVQKTSWERSVQVEQYKTVTEQDWSVPEGGRVKSQRKEIHHYNRVLDRYETRTRTVSDRVQTGTTTRVCGKRDLGNGYFQDKICTDPVYETRTRTETYQDPIYRQDPVYQTKYTYDIEKWVPIRTERAGGIQLNPSWPKVNLGKNERKGQQIETYTVDFIDKKGKTYSVPMNQNEWDDYQLGQSHKVKVTNASDRVEVLTNPQK